MLSSRAQHSLVIHKSSTAPMVVMEESFRLTARLQRSSLQHLFWTVIVAIMMSSVVSFEQIVAFAQPYFFSDLPTNVEFLVTQSSLGLHITEVVIRHPYVSQLLQSRGEPGSLVALLTVGAEVVLFVLVLLAALQRVVARAAVPWWAARWLSIQAS